MDNFENNNPSTASASASLSDGESEENSFAQFGNDLARLEETPSKFEKHQKRINGCLKWELQKIIGKEKLNLETRLHHYQIEAVLKIEKHFQDPSLEGEVPKALIVAPPGSGKSGMVTFIPYVLGSKRVLILTPSRIISEQLAADFGHPKLEDHFFLKSGVFNAKNNIRHLVVDVALALTQNDMDSIREKKLVIANVQQFGGLSRNSLSGKTRTPEQRGEVIKKLDEFDTIIVDEAHHYPAATWLNVVNSFRDKKIIFVTATPYNGKGELTLPSSVKNVYEIQRSELEGKTIRNTEFLELVAECRTLEPPFFEQLSEDILVQLTRHSNQEPRNPKPQAIILVKTKAEAQLVAKELGDNATFVISDRDSSTINLSQFTKGEKQIVVVCGMLREGYDNPNVTLVVILRKCKSRVLFEQFCGRCMRMNRSFQNTTRSMEPDRTIGTVLSYKHYDQKAMWEIRGIQAEVDPEEELGNDDPNGPGVNLFI